MKAMPVSAKPAVSRQTLVIALVAAITLLGLAVRLYNLGSRSLWYDEVASVENARDFLAAPAGDAWGPLAFAKRDRVPPLFFIILSLFYRLDPGEAMLRLPSAIFGALSIPLMYLFARRFTGDYPALVAALLLALSPFAVYYSQEMRPYSLFLLFSILAFLFYMLARQKRSLIYLAGLVLSVALGFYSHTYMALVMVLLDIWFLLDWKANRPLLFRWILAHVAILILCLPELYILFYHMGRGNTSLADNPPGLLSIAGTFYVFIFGRFFFPTRANLPIIAVFGLAWGISLLAGAWVLYRDRKTENGRSALLFVLSSVALFALVWLVSFTVKPLFDEGRVNYLIFLLPVFLLVAALGVARFPWPKIGYALLAGALVLSVAANLPYFFQWDTLGKGSFRDAAGFMRASLDSDETIYHTENTSTLPIDYYLGSRGDYVLLDPSAPPDYAAEDSFWLVDFRTSGGVAFMQSGQETAPTSADERCRAAFPDPAFDLEDAGRYPGKNDLLVCHFQRENR